MAMVLLRRLTEGLGAWLHYEFCCDRSELFSEKYLAPPVGILLSSAQIGRVFAEFTHPILAPLMTGRGRRPALDFVISESWPTPKLAIESKWVSESNFDVSSIVWDLVRLSLLNLHYGTECYFVLGGQKRMLNRLFLREEFAGPANRSDATSILNYKSNHSSSLHLVPDQHYRVPLLRKVFEAWPPTLEAPQKIVTRRTAPFPKGQPSYQYQVFAWQITCPPNKEVFRPGNSKHYQFPTNSLNATASTAT
jgi:hypothetical protein